MRYNEIVEEGWRREMGGEISGSHFFLLDFRIIMLAMARFQTEGDEEVVEVERDGEPVGRGR